MLENAVVVCVQALVESSKDGKTTTHLLGSHAAYVILSSWLLQTLKKWWFSWKKLMWGLIQIFFLILLVDFQVYEDMFPCIFYFESTEIHSNIFFFNVHPCNQIHFCFFYICPFCSRTLIKRKSLSYYDSFFYMWFELVCPFLLTPGHHEHHCNGFASLI
jgi:hypothetical protein